MTARFANRLVVWAVACIVVLAWGEARTALQAQDSAVASSANREAERAYEAVLASVSTSDDAHTEELARRFLVRFARDPLAPRVELELGRLFVLRAMPSPERPVADGARDTALNEAESWLARATAHADAPTAQRASLYRGVASYLRGRFDEAITALTALRGALVDQEDRRVHQTALNAACQAASQVGCALEALDAMRTECRDDVECSAIDEQIAAVSDASLTDDAARTWVLTTEPTRFAWRALATRVIRRASQEGDWELVQAIVARARAADVALDAEGREIATRLERGLEPNPRVIGVIAGLTGPSPTSAMACVQAIGQGAGSPPDNRFDPNAYRIIVRDHHGAPADAAHAVSELFWIHRVIAIVGPSDEESARAAAERASVLGVPFVSLVPVTTSRFVTGPVSTGDAGWLRREAIARFGGAIAFVVPRTARPDTTAEEFAHAAGRFDAATRARLSASSASYLVLEARAPELERLVASVRASIRRRPLRAPRRVFVLDWTAYDRLAPRVGREVLEGSVVLEIAREAHAGTSLADEARLAFDRIVATRAQTRTALAGALTASAAASPEASRVVAYRVADGRLVPIAD